MNCFYPGPLLLLLLLFCTSFSFYAQEATTEKGQIIRVLSYNIHHGAGADGVFHLENAATVIKDLSPDLVALQEVDQKTTRVDGRDITLELSESIGIQSNFQKATDFAGGDYGQAVLSKYPFIKNRKYELPGQPDKEPRIAIEALIELSTGDTLQFLGTHLDHTGNSPDRIEQAKELNQLRNQNFPVILAGDFNDTPGSETIALLESQWGLAYSERDKKPTFPSPSAEKKIDFIMFYPKDRWKVIKTEVVCDPTASDHCALLVVLKLLPQR